MQDVTPTIDSLLSSGFNVVVYTGNLDLICCSIGTWDWMDRTFRIRATRQCNFSRFKIGLTWSGYSKFKAAPLRPLIASNVIAGYDKRYSNLRAITIFGAGHSS